MLQAINQTKDRMLAARVRVASSFIDRARGLLGTAFLAAGEGLWIKPCQGVHTLFMRYAIDVVHLDRNGKVIHCGTMGPWRLGAWIPRSVGVLELPAGTIERTETVVGDRIELKAVE